MSADSSVLFFLAEFTQKIRTHHPSSSSRSISFPFHFQIDILQYSPLRIPKHLNKFVRKQVYNNYPKMAISICFLDNDDKPACVFFPHHFRNDCNDWMRPAGGQKPRGSASTSRPRVGENKMEPSFLELLAERPMPEDQSWSKWPEKISVLKSRKNLWCINHNYIWSTWLYMRIHEVWKEIQSIFIVLSLLGTQMWRLGEPKASMPKPMGMRRQLGKGTVDL